MRITVNIRATGMARHILYLKRGVDANYATLLLTHLCRYFAPERDMQLTRDLYPDPFTYAAFLKTSGYDGTQDIDTVRRKLQP